MAHSSIMLMKEENLDQPSDLVQIFDANEIHPILIHAQQLNPFFHTLLGHPFQRLKYFHSRTKLYQFYRTPGIISYIISYYLHHGCLATETHFPAEILYDELTFFGFNIQMIYQVVSHHINIEYYIPSGKYRRAFWFLFHHHRRGIVTSLLCGLIDLSSVITSLVLLELINVFLIHSLIHRILITEILLTLFTSIEFSLRYVIRPKLFQINAFLSVLHLLAWFPLSLFLYIWPMPGPWLYTLLTLQLAARIIRCLRLSSRAYHLISVLSDHWSLCLLPCQSIALVVIFFSLILLAVEQISSPPLFLSNSTRNSLRSRPLFSEVLWIIFNAFTSVGEGTSRPGTRLGLLMEFLTCFIGMISIPQFVQNVYSIVSKTLDEQKLIEEKRKQKHLVMIEDEYGHRAIGQIHRRDQLPEVLIQKEEF